VTRLLISLRASPASAGAVESNECRDEPIGDEDS
jgi:hypothetical protein